MYALQRLDYIKPFETTKWYINMNIDIINVIMYYFDLVSAI